MRVTLRDIGLALAVPIIWGMGIVFAKAGLDEFPPLFLMSMRFIVSAVVLVWFFPIPTGQLRAIFLIALVSATIQYGLTFYGLAGLDASTAVLFMQLEVPFSAACAAIFLNDKLGWKRACGMVVSFFGVVLIAGAPSLRNQLFPAFLVIAGVFTWAIGQVMIKKMVTITGFQLIAWVSVFAGPQMLAASLILESGHLSLLKNATLIGWGSVIYMGIVMTALGYGIWYHLLKKYDVNQVIPFLLLLPVTSILGAVLFLGERPSIRILIGGVVVITGVAVIVMLGQSKTPDKTDA
ncbi:MAG: EamA family transporter [Desulfobacterales bacterium]|jgi:O-acetylserine/cysteine efflux transporter